MTNKITLDTIRGEEVLRDESRPKFNVFFAQIAAAINSLIDDVSSLVASNQSFSVSVFDDATGYDTRPNVKNGLWVVVGPVDAVDRDTRDIWIETEE